MIRAGAPGKVVLWGEYAVLAGAPALVMAVDRFACCELEITATPGWEFTAIGHRAPPASVSLERLRSAEPPEPGAVWALAWHVLHGLDGARLPAGVRARLDTSGFFRGGAKLGLGSSAALCVALYAGLCRLLERPASFAEARRIHCRVQGGAGSGVDVAAAWYGGTIRFQRPPAAGATAVDEHPGYISPWAVPDDLHLGFLWTGTPASTTDHLARLGWWLDGGGGSELDALADRSARVFDTPTPAALAEYVDALDALDRAAGLGIFSDAHRRLHRLAIDAGVVYKPCGAGGGDVGAAFAADPDAVERFIHQAASEGYLPLALETASHGIEITG